MNWKKDLLCKLALYFCPVTVLAQSGIRWQWEPEFSYTFGLADRWKANLRAGIQQTFYETDTRARYRINYSQVQFFATYQLWTNTQLSGGYGFRFTELLDRPLGHEHQLIEQFTFLVYLGGTRLGNRLRTEQQFEGRTFVNQWRYRLAYETPLQGQRLDPGERYLLIFEELLYTFNAKERFAENRFYVGVGWYVNEKKKLETGLQYRLRKMGVAPGEHTIWLTTVYYLNR